MCIRTSFSLRFLPIVRSFSMYGLHVTCDEYTGRPLMFGSSVLAPKSRPEFFGIILKLVSVPFNALCSVLHSRDPINPASN